MDSGDFKAEHHPLIVDGLVCLQKLIHGFVDGLGDSALDDMAHPDRGAVDGLSPEELLGCLMDCLHKGRVRNGYLVIFGENRDYTITLQVAE